MPAVSAAERAALGLPPVAYIGLWLYAAALILLLLVGSVAQRFRPGPEGIALTELLAILLPALVFSWDFSNSHWAAQRQRVLRFLRLTPLTKRLPLALLGGVLFGAGWFYGLSVWIEPIIEHVFPVPPQERANLLHLLRPSGGLRPLWQDLLCFAAVPAVCEEVLFRGAMLPMLRPLLTRRPLDGIAKPTAGEWRAAVLCALLFGAFHLSGAKLLPTMLLGFGFGAAVLWSGSLYSAIAMHFTNNALVIILVRSGYDDAPAGTRALIDETPRSGAGLPIAPGLLWLGAATFALVLGYRLLRGARSVEVDPPNLG